MSCCASPPEVSRSAPKTSSAERPLYEGPGPWTTCFPDSLVEPRLAKSGLAGPETPSATLPELLKKAVERRGKVDALLVERPVPALDGHTAPPALPREEWTTWTFEKYHKDVCTMAKAFLSLGFKQFDSVNVWGYNAPEWLIGAMAGIYVGGKVAGLYPTDTPDGAAYKVVHSGASIVVVEDRGKVDKLVKSLSSRGDCKHVKAFISWAYDPPKGEKVTIEGVGEVPFMSWKSAMQLGQTISDADLNKSVQAVKPGHCAALIYTSGTTGDPKAVMISHDTWVYEANAVISVISRSTGFSSTNAEERIVSYLPLSHVAGMLMDIVAPVVMTAWRPGWSSIFFARPYDLKAGSIKDRLVVARPTIFLGVPLVWEKMADKLRAIAAQSGGCLSKISGWAKGKALALAKTREVGNTAVIPSGYCTANRFLSIIKGKLGLDQCKFAFTGAAPIRAETVEYFASIGITLCEVYGMSESCGVATASTAETHQLGSCGYTFPGTEVQIFKCDPNDFNVKTAAPKAKTINETDDKYMGEICFRGRHIMMGYLACKDLGEDHVASIEKKTAEAIDAEGWLHSGDKGFMTELGMLKISGRYKELIIGEGGENIAPVPIEDNVKTLCSGINEIMMVGDQRKYNVALITLKAIGANGDTPGTDKLDAGAKMVNAKVSTISDAIKDKIWIDTVSKAIQDTNANAKICLNNAFKIQKFSILPTNFSEEQNELTPTKKLKRKVVEEKYNKIIEKMYATDGMYITYEATE